MKGQRFTTLAVWLEWTALTSLGWGIGAVISLGLVAQLAMTKPSWEAALATWMCATGASVGLAQWLILRRTSRSSWLWIPVTALSFPGGAYVSAFISSAFMRSGPYLRMPDSVSTLLMGIVMSCTFGSFLGVLQWYSLRRGLNGMVRWILISILSWGAGIGLMWFLVVMPSIWTVTVPPDMPSEWEFLARYMLVGIFVGAVGGLFVDKVLLGADDQRSAVSIGMKSTV